MGSKSSNIKDGKEDDQMNNLKIELYPKKNQI